MSRILFVGDLQIGAGQQYGTPEQPRLADQAEAWDWIATKANAEWDADAVVLLGDVFEKRHPTPDELLVFQWPLLKLRDCGIDVLAIVGNHDVSAESAASALQVFSELNVHRSPRVWGTVATLPWTPPHRLAAAHGRDQINERVAAHLIACARELRETTDGGNPILGPPDVLALHWSISGGVTASGVETISLAEPVLPIEQLLELGYRWIIAGHIHKAQVLNQDPLVLVAGSPMVSDFGEAEQEHAVYVLDTDTGSLQWFHVPDRPFVTLDFDHENPAAQVALSDSLGWDVQGAVVRVRYTATPEQAAQVDHAAIERALYDAGAHKVYAIEPTILRERRARVESMDETLDPLEALDAWMGAQNVAGGQDRMLRDYTAEKLERA